ncbi:MAG: glutamine--fructose-6-phosphate transaminase (isomerizing) [Trueperaceae bacterium]|nr:glutamine--fructose-6-phosphate transaminase (isomerizing) [Trueperaceae bacterium]
MCGIVGYVGHRQASEVVLDGLKRLEYRGYDSAGVVVSPPERTDTSTLQSVKRAGKLGVLADALTHTALPGTLGLGHTRWATHGKPNDVNAHPHLSEDGRLAVIHNGIIENYQPLRERLQADGHVFASETDTEVLVHLTEAYYADERYRGDLTAAVRAALAEVSGAYALVVSHADHDQIVAARNTSPMVVGIGDGEMFVASDVPALLPYTREVIFLHDGDIALLERDRVTLTDADGRVIERTPTVIDWSPEAAEKAGFEHYMLKEIFEQPTVVQQTLAGRLGASDVDLDLGLDPAQIDRVVITAAGTAFYAGMVGEYLIEKLARLPVEVEVASEFRYREPILNERTLCIVVSQSGETIDTLEALREAKRCGAKTLAVLNVKGSSISREVDDVLYIHAGPEIGVASTKAYTAMVTAFALLALWIGRKRDTLSTDAATGLVTELRRIPTLIEEALRTRGAIAEVAERFKAHRDYLFLGRGINFPSALEGALKLKEISYIHAEAYATGEMKHGPIALIDDAMPVVAIATASALYDKTLSNLQEVKARDGIVIAIANDDDTQIGHHADVVIRVPETHELLSPLVNAVALQLLAYETAARLGRDVDQPRNLAKSVTVE